jgi:hypothetical protein
MLFRSFLPLTVAALCACVFAGCSLDSGAPSPTPVDSHSTGSVSTSSVSTGSVATGASSHVGPFAPETPYELAGVPLETGDATAARPLYTSRKLGISFRAPAEWGVPVESGERGADDCPRTAEDPCEMVTISFPKLAEASIFLASQSKLQGEHAIGRGGYWGDSSARIASENSVRDYCGGDIQASECRVYTTQGGIQVARSVEDHGMAGESDRFTTYFIHTPNPVFPGIVVADQSFRSLPQGTGEIQALVDSIKFVDRE